MPNAATISGVAASRIGNLTGWSLDADATPHSPSDDTAAVGELRVTGSPETADAIFVQGDDLTLKTANVGTISGTVNSVSVDSPLEMSVTSGDAFFRYVGERQIPAVGSGSPVAAIDMCQQIINGRRLNYSSAPLSDTGGIYWSLAGHDVGFDVRSEVVRPLNRDVIMLNDYSTAQDTTKMDSRRLFGTENNFTGYAYAQGGTDGSIYCSSGIGSSWRANDKPTNLIMNYDLTLPTSGDEHEFYIRTGGWVSSSTWDSHAYRLVINQTDMFLYVYLTADETTPDYTYTSNFATSYPDFDSTEELRVTVQLRSLQHSTAADTLNHIVTFSVREAPTPDGFVGPLGPQLQNTLGFSNPPKGTVPSDSKPFTMEGGLFRNLVMIESKDTTLFTPRYNITPTSDHYDATGLPDAMVSGVPIVGMTGTLWDYIKQIAGGLGVEFHADRGRVIRVVPVGSNVQPLPNYVSGIQRKIGDEDAALQVQLTNYEADLNHGSYIVYDARVTGETWSVGVNEQTTSIINVPHFPRLVEQPMPASITRNQAR